MLDLAIERRACELSNGPERRERSWLRTGLAESYEEALGFVGGGDAP